MTPLDLTRDMANDKADFDLTLHRWRNLARIATTKRDAGGKFTTERKTA